MTSLEALQTPEQDIGWIAHDGKGMPVDGAALVYVRFRDGYEDTKDRDGNPLEPSHADEWCDNWNYPALKPGFADIVAYRLHKPSPSSQGEEQ